MTELLLFIGGGALGAVLTYFALRGKNDSHLLQMAEAKMRELGASSKADMTALLAPLSTTLQQLREHTHVLEKNRTEAYTHLHTLVETLKDGQQHLQRETGRLAQRLYNPQTRGRWGELQLQNIIERAGMKPYCDFSMQESQRGESDTRRPDMIVRLPGGACIAVDAKTPMDAYDAIVSAVDESALAAARASHAAHLRRHVKELNTKAYWERLPSPELVVLFLPGDHLLHSALEADAQLLDDALAANVLIATPATLLALLKAVAYGWRQETLAENAQKVSDLGNELYTRLGTMAGYVQKLGASLSGAMKSYNEFVGSLESRVLPAARKFEELGIGGDKKGSLSLEPIDDIAPRSLSAAEFADEKLKKLG